MALSTFRQRLHQKYRKYRAIRILTNTLTASERAAIDSTLQNIEQMPTTELRKWAKSFDSTLNWAIKHYGVVGSLEELEEPIRLDFPDDRYMGWGLRFISKAYLCELFQHYENALPVFPKLPPHGRVGLDVYAIGNTKGTMETFQLEASLFEDMAALWNTALASSSKNRDSKSTPFDRKLAIKNTAALGRAAAKAAFNLLEGYLNGLALDILLTQSVSDENRRILSEWDEERKRSLSLSLRDKILQYPKIAIGRDHPPIQESSTPAMKLVLNLERQVRHALIHPTPWVSFRNPSEDREQIFFQLEIEDVAPICDAVLDLISIIAETVGNAYGDVSLWLIKRGADGRFPEEAFQ